MQQFDAIFKIFGRAIFEAIEVNFEVTTSKFCNHFWKFGCQPNKGKADLGMINGSKVLIYLTLIFIFLFAFITRLSLWRRIKKLKLFCKNMNEPKIDKMEATRYHFDSFEFRPSSPALHINSNFSTRGNIQQYNIGTRLEKFFCSFRVHISVFSRVIFWSKSFVLTWKRKL